MITMSPKAVNEIKRLIIEDPATANGGGALRVQVVGGGCSGMSYKLAFESTAPGESDNVMDVEGIKVYVDSKSLLYLNGMTLDFSDGLNGTGFVFNNPNAKRTCGCGTSFSA